MKKFVTISLLSALSFSNLFATHNRAGEITYRQISQYTYEITLITYTYTPSAANEQRDYLEMIWGDNTVSDIERIRIDYLANDIQKNTYIGQHTFPGAGVYQLVMSDPNRNDGIENIPNSVTVLFSLKTTLKIDPALGFNNTPVLLNPPVDRAALGQIFIHNPSAYDPDGDSLSYKLSVCLGDNALPIENYQLPDASISLSVDPVTGNFIWNAPTAIGEYNVAMEIEEWRNGIKIGSIIRDMQIEVEESDNRPPVITALGQFCVTAGDSLGFNVTAVDPDGDNLKLSAYGGPFEYENNPAVFPEISGTSPLSQIFYWNTICEHIRYQPYSAIFKAEDDNPEVTLSDYEDAEITVVAPAPENLAASPSSNNVFLSWNSYTCSNAAGFKIYRRYDTYSFTPDPCETGLPDYTGYTYVATIDGADKTSYLDNGTGTGLPQGYNYCYRITAYFNDGAESYASNEACAELVKATPIFIETSVYNTDTQNGSIHLAWVKPAEFDNIQYPGPYVYVLESSPDMYGQNYANQVDISGIDNTTFTDTIINTKDNATSYKLTLYNDDGTTREQIGTPGYSASVFIKGHPQDRKMLLEIIENVPWTNHMYVIYRKNADENCTPDATPYDSVGFTTDKTYTDYGLVNGENYFYFVKSIGEYDLAYLPKPLINYSQEICVSPQDTIPPCPVSLRLESECSALYNKLTWTPDNTCENDISKYFIYYTPTTNGTYELISTVENNSVTQFIHYPDETLAGCYVVSPADSAGNFTAPENLQQSCIDNCEYYSLPNVFTPGGDGTNDIFKPFPYKFVEKIDLKIYNRWGNLVFETENPDINWDGTDMKTKKTVSDGVYYYICDVYEKRLSGTEIRNLNGFVRIIGNTGNAEKP